LLPNILGKRSIACDVFNFSPALMRTVTISESSSTDNNLLASLTIKDTEISPVFDANMVEI